MIEFYHVCYHVFIIFYCLQAEMDRHSVSQCCMHEYGVMYCTHVVGMMLCRGKLATYSFSIVSLFAGGKGQVRQGMS